MVSILVSKVAILSALSRWRTRQPLPQTELRFAPVAPLLTASERVVVRLMEKACVGPPATIKSTSDQDHGAPDWSTDARPVVDWAERVELGGVHQWVLARGRRADNPVLLVLGARPGGTATGWFRDTTPFWKSGSRPSTRSSGELGCPSAAVHRSTPDDSGAVH
jgi:hypothetical protein